MVAKKQYKLALFPLLSKINTKDVGYYDTLSEEAIKEFSPLVIMRWLTSAKYPSKELARHIFFLNLMINPYVFHIGQKHKKLMYYLMTTATAGKDLKYTFIKAKGKRGSTMPLAVGIIQEVFGYNTRDAHDAIALLTDDAIVDMADQLGKQQGEIKELKKELKAKRPK